MLLYGSCNPRGEDETYNGLYLTQNEMRDTVKSRELIGVPVKAEHSGSAIGSIVSVEIGQDNRLYCLLEIDESSLPGSLTSGFIRDGVATELSLGYSVDVKNTDDNKLKAGKKNILEVSVVKKGARSGCHIVAVQDMGAATKFRRTCWDGYFDLQ